MKVTIPAKKPLQQTLTDPNYRFVQLRDTYEYDCEDMNIIMSCTVVRLVNNLA